MDFFTIGSIIIDDIVLPDGETRMGILGGGATHAAMGILVWSDSVGIAASIGDNFPDVSMDQLKKVINTDGLHNYEVETPRAWQVYEENGHRTEVFRSDLDEFINLTPDPQQLPKNYCGAKGVHIQCKSPEPLKSWIQKLRTEDCGLILWEPWDIYCQPENRQDFREILPLVDIFSPNLEEARVLTSQSGIKEILKKLFQYGATRIVLRMGERGSVVADSVTGYSEIPVFQVNQITDVTGAGNAYCGGFLVGYTRTTDMVQAGMYGAVSASLALEQFGALYSRTDLHTLAEQRLATLYEDQFI